MVWCADSFIGLIERFGDEFGEFLGLVVAAGDNLERLELGDFGLQILGGFVAAPDDGLKNIH